MQLPKFEPKKVEQFLAEQNKYILNLFSICAIPERPNNSDDTILQDSEKQKLNLQNGSTKKPRAQSLHELEERLKSITSKKKLSYKEKLTKKGLKNRLKKKNKQDIRNANLKLERAAKLTVKTEPSDNNPETQNNTQEVKKPVFNSENKLVFSKIDFANLGKKKVKKVEKDPEKLLKKLNEEKSRLEQLESAGETSKVVEIKEKAAWKNALAKAEGEKVKDDPILLKKSVVKKEQKVRSSKKKWEARIEGVKKAKDDRQKKRKENIDKRKKQKKVKQLKSAAKRGKIIPGY